jgi:hypothetical protein
LTRSHFVFCVVPSRSCSQRSRQWLMWILCDAIFDVSLCSRSYVCRDCVRHDGHACYVGHYLGKIRSSSHITHHEKGIIFLADLAADVCLSRAVVVCCSLVKTSTFIHYLDTLLGFFHALFCSRCKQVSYKMPVS